MSLLRPAGTVLFVAAAAVSCAAPPPGVAGAAGAPPVRVYLTAADDPAPAAQSPSALDSAVAAATAGDPDAGRAASPEAAAAPRADRWSLATSMYLWLFDIDGSVANAGKTVPISMHLQDSWDLVKDHGDLCLAGHVEARRGDWSFFFDANVLQFEAEESASKEIQRGLGTVDAKLDASLDIAVFEVGAAWRAGDVPLGGGSRLPVEILGGVRWTDFDLDVDLDVTRTGARHSFEKSYGPDVETSWADPFVGLRTRVELSDSVDLLLRGDIGGGFGEGSDFVWNVTALLGFRISENVTAFAGWRWYEFHRDIHDRDTDLQLEGPGIGVEFRF